MRHGWVTILACAFALVSIVKGASAQNFEVHLIGALPPSLVLQQWGMPQLDNGAEVSIISSGKSQLCWRSDVPGELCWSSLARGTIQVRIEIRVRGYKTYTLNVPRLIYRDGVVRVNIGVVSMVKSDLPTVERVLAGQDKNGARVFELMLLNKLSHDVLITNLKVHADRPGVNVSCAFELISVYDISERLTVTGGGAGNLNTNGQYVERVSGNDYVVTTTGHIHLSNCGGGVNLDLSLPVSFVIPKDSFSAVRIIVPEEFNFQGSSDSDLPNRLSQFATFSFALSTHDKDELDIEAAYPSKPDAGSQVR